MRRELSVRLVSEAIDEGEGSGHIFSRMFTIHSFMHSLFEEGEDVSSYQCIEICRISTLP